MAKFVTTLAFGFIYSVMYMMPFTVPFIVLDSLVDSAVTVVSAVKAVLAVLGLVGFVFAFYRAKYAADALAFEGMTFWEAHSTSWAMVRTNLSFLPVVGRFFKNPTDDKRHPWER
ncbi:MAG: hypothetical protein FVQ80_17035 [Planctomycetes bacterium]|nr:hypothetical protein [Planctomycetota bacterium]